MNWNQVLILQKNIIFKKCQTILFDIYTADFSICSQVCENIFNLPAVLAFANTVQYNYVKYNTRRYNYAYSRN